MLDDAGETLAGACTSKRLEVCSTLAVIESVSTLAHELTHWGLHYDGEGRDRGFSREFEEEEARAVERALLERYGVLPASAAQANATDVRSGGPARARSGNQ